MPKYLFRFDVGFRSLKSIGTLVFDDDEKAIAEFRDVASTTATLRELWRPDRKKLLARVHPDGVFERLAPIE